MEEYANGQSQKLSLDSRTPYSARFAMHSSGSIAIRASRSALRADMADLTCSPGDNTTTERSTWYASKMTSDATCGCFAAQLHGELTAVRTGDVPQATFRWKKSGNATRQKLASNSYFWPFHCAAIIQDEPCRASLLHRRQTENHN